MKIKLLINFIIIFCIVFSSQLSASTIATPQAELPSDAQNIGFVIRSAEIAEWLIRLDNVSYEQDLNKETSSEEYKRLRVLAITFDVVNESNVKKLNLEKGFTVTLSDEFGNEYKKLNPPVDYMKPVNVRNPSYPSFYPDEIFSKTIFFEVPVRSSRDLYVSIDAASLGFNEPVRLRIPIERIKESHTKEFNGNEIPEDAITVKYPANNLNVKPGQQIPMGVQILQGVPVPTKLYVISPNDLLEDDGRRYHYQLRIPANQEKGPYRVLVMGEWYVNSHLKTVSTSFVLNVIGPGEIHDKDFSGNEPTENLENL